MQHVIKGLKTYLNLLLRIFSDVLVCVTGGVENDTLTRKGLNWQYKSLIQEHVLLELGDMIN